ncbi:MAG TPA: LytTR family DNA-binding domain-containing protein [Thermoanaerobaculia bacterium]|jgi:two-component system LytT family response regulator|nr:LytTR family DNA-binding domain-containing protein [Thermoanaerobaculia bacterium]
MKIRALVVDDEPRARKAVCLLLERDPDVEICGECSGAEAAELIENASPDLMFLDVQMPEVDGFDLLEAVGAEAVPAVVFITAYDEYAVRAFDVHAIDYLLKPFDDARFARALARAKEQLARRSGQPDPHLAALVRERSPYVRRFLVRQRERLLVVNAEDVDWIEAADYYASLHVGAKTHLLRETLANLEQRLDPERFFRVHRSAIVNVDRVREIHPLFRGDCALVLGGGTQVRLSRTRREDFERLFTTSRR